MQNKPLVSVVLPVYNGEEFLAQSIQSVINQTYTNWELIIVDDCSTDNSSKIAKDFALKDERIRVVKNEENLKLPASLNRGFENAKGEYYTWTSDDNEYYPEAFEKMVDFLQNNPYFGMVYGICEVENCPCNQLNLWGEVAATPENLLEFNVCAACFLYRACVAKNVGQFNTETFLAEDHDYNLRIRLKYNIANISEVLYKYRLHKNNLTSKYKNIARLKGIELSVKYHREYYQKFPYLKKIFNNKFELQDILVSKDEIAYKKIKKDCTKKYLYQELKRFFILTKDLFYIEQIIKLGVEYSLRALLLEFKARKVMK